MSAIGAPDLELVAVVVADGDVDEVALARALDLPAGTPRLVICADGGARHALRAGLVPDLVVGDGDSLDDSTRARLATLGVPVRGAPTGKDESDTELCVLAALERGARVVRIVGALGGPRPEHAVANILLLGHPALDAVEAELVTAVSTMRRIGTTAGPGRLTLPGEVGDLVSLFPLDGRVEGVTTHGLRFALADEPLLLGPARGLSNEVSEPPALITARRGRLLVIHTRPARTEV